jgi:ABC-type Na+ efflux pump permease subunit
MRELNAVITIVARDILLAFKSPFGLIMSLAMPIVMMGMLGGSLAQNMTAGLNFNYGQFMPVGMLINMLFMFTTQRLTSLVEDRITDFTQEMMIAPVSRYSIVIGKIFGSSFGGIIGMIVTLAIDVSSRRRLTYCLDLTRAVVYAGTSEYANVVLFNPVINCAAIVGLTIIFLIVGTYGFVRLEKNR